MNFINTERLEQTWRYCQHCDPSCSTPIQCLPQTCSCGYVLVVAPKTLPKDRGQYAGSVQRYSKPVALVTGNADDALGPLIF
jgi:hypothetical protein